MITIAETAKVLGRCPQYIRIAMQRGNLPIGQAIKFDKNYSYNISEHKLAEYLGCSVEEVMKLAGR